MASQLQTKEEYYVHVKSIREMLASEKGSQCTCPNFECGWHGDCCSCIRIHRHFSNHIPNCLQFILEEKIEKIAEVAEMNVVKKPGTPQEYRKYVQEQDWRQSMGQRDVEDIPSDR